MTALAWTLLHFLWQGVVIAAAAALILRSGAWTASTRYLVGVAALSLMVAAPVATFGRVTKASPVVSAWSFVNGVVTVVPADTAHPPIRLEEAVARTGALRRSAAYAPMVVWTWAAGVALLTVRLFGGWVVARRLARHQVRPATSDLRTLAGDMSARLGVTRFVEVYESMSVAVPVVVGWLSPVVLFPAAALAGLPLAQVQALLAHELAHVRRHDYVVNLLQTMVETVLFYHPAVWWISRQVRIEREHCCDDLAVSVCDRVDYVNALSAMAAMTPVPALALAATDGSLVERVRRLLTSTGDLRRLRSPSMSAIAMALILSVVPIVMAATPPLSGAVKRVSEAVAQRTDAAFSSGASSPAIRLGIERVEPQPIQSAGAIEPHLFPEMDEVTPRLVPSGREVPDQVAPGALDKAADEREAARQARADERANLQVAFLTVQLEEAKVRAREAQKQLEQGLVAAQDVNKTQNQVAELGRRLAALEDGAASPQRLETDLSKLREAIAASVRELEKVQDAQRAQGPTPDRITIMVRPNALSRSALYFFAASRPYVQDGPSVLVHVLESAQAKLADGRRISALRFTGWSEGDKVRVMVVALVPREGEAPDYTTDAKRLTNVDVGTYLLAAGHTTSLEELTAFGIIDVSVEAVSVPSYR